MSRGFTQGDHICALYETAEEQLAVAAHYLADGLRRRERCDYVGPSPAGLTRFRAALAAEGIDADAAVKKGALIMATTDSAHLDGGRFESERMLRMLNDAVEAALNAGFVGLRTCGDMSWLLGEPEGAEQVVEYEALLNEFFRGVRALGMCQYDRARLPPHLVDHALATHGSVTVGRHHTHNPFYEPPAVAVRRIAQTGLVSSKINHLRRDS